MENWKNTINLQGRKHLTLCDNKKRSCTGDQIQVQNSEYRLLLL